MKGNVNYLELANSPLMWVSAAIAVGIVVFQSVLFFRKSLKAAKEIGIETLTPDELERMKAEWKA